ncbi:MAG: hypothetical protein RLZZ437_1828 [Pseudomonadota bacterium]
MVERMSSVEIEDVLSSIRRLVAEDLRPKPAAVEDKLILTPALRVVPDPVVAPNDALDIDLDADLAAALNASGADDSTQVSDAEVTASDDLTEADVAAFPMFLHHANRVDLAAEPNSADVADTVTTIGAGLPEDGYEAELGDVMPVPDWPESSWVAPDVIDVVEDAEVIAAPVSEDAAEADVSGNWAEEAPEVPAFAGQHDGTAEDDAAEAAAIAALAEEESDFADQPALTELDEDMLRDIVREIIREELQGGLGERITRNVRKLVRAEINRALMTQDLD